jgi:hypothetical protein
VQKAHVNHSGIDDNVVAQQVLLNGDQPTYHYVDPSTLSAEEAKVPPKWWKRPQFLGSLILLVAMGIGATALVLVTTNKDQNTVVNTKASTAVTGASTGNSVEIVPSGIVAPFLRET